MEHTLHVLSVGTPILGNAVYHDNLCASLAGSNAVRLTRRSVSDYWDFRAKVLFATVASPRLSARSYRHRAEWVLSEVARRGIRREVAALRPDVVHCHTQAHALRCHGMASGLPFVASGDATAHRLARLPAYRTQQPAFEKIIALESRLFAACAVVGGVSRWVTDSLREDYGVSSARLRLCSPCVDTDFFAPRSKGEGEPTPGKLRVVFVGNDLERKGGKLLLEAMRGGLSTVCVLNVVSGVPEPPDLPAGVTWHNGLKPRTPALLAQLQTAEVFALPTYEDCFPQALVEAMAVGLPLIGTGVMGVPELVQNGVNGFCVPAGDIDALAAALRTLAGSAELRRRFAEASRRMALERFSLGVSRATWEEVFTSAHKMKRGSGRESSA